MPLTLIRGSFRVLGAAPDGDSVRFIPDDRQAWAKARINARVNAAGGAQLRLDAIDALETHYTPMGGSRWHQPVGLAEAAAGRLLELLGFSGVSRAGDGTVIAAAPELTPGFVLTNSADKHGRPLALAYSTAATAPVLSGAGQDPATDALPGAGQQDGSSVWLDAAGLRQSVNFQLLAEGLVYPTFYAQLYVQLRTVLADQAVAARQAGLGIWAADVTNAGFTVSSRQQIQSELVLLPKLFRRLADYLALQAPDDVDLAGFGAYLAVRDDRLFTVPDGHATGLNTLIQVSGQQVNLTVPPERIIFLEQ